MDAAQRVCRRSFHPSKRIDRSFALRSPSAKKSALCSCACISHCSCIVHIHRKIFRYFKRNDEMKCENTKRENEKRRINIETKKKEAKKKWFQLLPRSRRSKAVPHTKHSAHTIDVAIAFGSVVFCLVWLKCQINNRARSISFHALLSLYIFFLSSFLSYISKQINH